MKQLLVGLCFAWLITGQANEAAAQQVLMRASEMKQRATAAINSPSDTRLKKRAEELLGLLGVQEWNFAAGKSPTGSRSIIGNYHGLFSRNDRMIIRFEPQATSMDMVDVPLVDLETFAAQPMVAKILKLGQELGVTLAPSTKPLAPTAPCPSRARFSTTWKGERYQIPEGEVFEIVGKEGDKHLTLLIGGNEVPVPRSHLQPYRQPELASAAPIPRLHVRFLASERGLMITEVFEDGLGDQMGLRAGDKIITVNDLPVRDEQEFAEAAARGNGRFTIVAQNERGPTRVIKYPPARRPKQPASESDTSLGITGAFHEGAGMFQVSYVSPKGLGKRIGLRKDVFIFKINGVRLTDLEKLELVEAKANGRYEIEGSDEYGNEKVWRTR